jgi:hypothetical protein
VASRRRRSLGEAMAEWVLVLELVVIRGVTSEVRTGVLAGGVVL